MKQLFAIFYQQLHRVSTSFTRYLYHDIHWNNRLIGITGARGAGKTTVLLQHIHNNKPTHANEVLYASLDNLWFSTHSLLYLAEEFVKMGGKRLYLDEVHYYKGWSREIKNIYDSFPELYIVFTGSSLLELYKGEADLSRRLIWYKLPGLSFREFLNFEYGLDVSSYSIDDIVHNHMDISHDIQSHIKPIMAFREYLRYGYFPYYKEDKELYHSRLLQTLNTVIEKDMPIVERIDYVSVVKIKKLFAVIAGLAPYTPNILQLSKDIEATRVTVLNFLFFLEKAQTLILVNRETSGIKQMAKPDKIYLGNTNYAFALAEESANIGSIRESFFANQLMIKNQIQFSDKVDFVVNKTYNIEVGGKNKTRKQITGLSHAYIAVDDIEHGFGNQIPLWLFGLLY